MTAELKIPSHIPDHWPREKKIENLMGIAFYLSKHWKSVDNGLVTMDSDDIYQVAAMAIVKAVDTYNPSHGAKLSTWATSQAKLFIRDAVRKNSHATRSMQEKGNNIRWVSFDQCVSDGTGDMISIEDIISESQSFSSVDIIDLLHKDWERQKIEEYLQRLNKREQEVIREYISGKSISSIAKSIDVCDSRVYQIIDTSIKKMQNYDRIERKKEEISLDKLEKHYNNLGREDL